MFVWTAIKTYMYANGTLARYIRTNYIGSNFDDLREKNIMDFEFFIGRLHPLIVHLPIGFLLLAGILQGLGSWNRKRFPNLDLAISIALLCGVFSSIGAAVVGWFLAGGGGYDPDTLFWHKWFGIILTLVTFLGWLLKSRIIQWSQRVFYWVLGLVLVLVTVTGHLGGNLTHGDDYLLAYAPASLQKLFGYQVEKGLEKIPSRPDSVLVFDHLIKPALKAKCYECHNETKQQGGLLLTTTEGMMKGGDSGENIVSGNAHESPLFQRVTYPQSSSKFMPPKGDPLTYSELKLIEWWINMGASFENKLSDIEPTEEIRALLLRDYSLDTNPKPIYDLLSAPPLEASVIERLTEEGFKINGLAAGHALYQVQTVLDSISEAQIQTLAVAKEQVTWLNLAGKGISDAMLGTIGQFSNLTRLRLQNNPITDAGMEHLRPLENLESLNVYGTGITDASLNVLEELPNLKRVFLWQTQVSSEAVATLKQNRPDLDVQMGMSGKSN